MTKDDSGKTQQPKDKPDKKELEELKKQNEELEEQVKRVLADYQNLEKRVAEQRQEWIKNANQDLLARLLPILDTLFLAQKHDQSKSLELTTQQFLDAIKSEGVEKIKTIGEKFNPAKMECIQVVGSTDEQDGIVVDETRPGFVLYDKVLRPAQVIVGNISPIVVEK